MSAAGVWHLGIDGGATHARWVALAPGGAPREGAAPSLNPTEAGVERWVGVVVQLVGEVLREVGASAEAPLTLGIGWAGAGSPELQAELAAALRPRFACQRLWIGHDARPALVAATDDPQAVGIVCIAGTGAVAWGRGPDGAEVRSGGWGAVLGDEGSGWALGLGALRLATRMADGRRPCTPLLDALLGALRLARPEDLKGWVRARDPAALKHDVAALAPVVLALAEAGEGAARHLRAHAAAHLALMTAAVHRRLGGGRLPIVCAGGLWRDSGLLDAYRRRLARWGVDPESAQPPGRSAAWGALRLGAAVGQ